MNRGPRALANVVARNDVAPAFNDDSRRPFTYQRFFLSLSMYSSLRFPLFLSLQARLRVRSIGDEPTNRHEHRQAWRRTPTSPRAVGRHSSPRRHRDAGLSHSNLTHLDVPHYDRRPRRSRLFSSSPQSTRYKTPICNFRTQATRPTTTKEAQAILSTAREQQSCRNRKEAASIHRSRMDGCTVTSQR